MGEREWGKGAATKKKISKKEKKIFNSFKKLRKMEISEKGLYPRPTPVGLCFCTVRFIKPYRDPVYKST